MTEGAARAPARAMLRAIGMDDDDFSKAQVGVASSWNEVTPCNMPLSDLAGRAKVGVTDAGATRSSSTPSQSATASPWDTRA